jgi:hypothetical protein
MGMIKIYTGDSIGSVIPSLKEDEYEATDIQIEKEYIQKNVSPEFYEKYVREYQEVCEYRKDDGTLDMKKTHNCHYGFFIEFQGRKLAMEMLSKKEREFLTMPFDEDEPAFKFYLLMSEFDRVGDDQDKIITNFPIPIRIQNIERLYREVNKGEYVDNFLNNDACYLFASDLENGTFDEKIFDKLKDFYDKTIEKQNKFIDDYMKINAIMLGNVFNQSGKTFHFVKEVQPDTLDGGEYDEVRKTITHRFDLLTTQLLIMWIDCSPKGKLFYNMDFIRTTEPTESENEIVPLFGFHYLQKPVCKHMFPMQGTFDLF